MYLTLSKHNLDEHVLVSSDHQSSNNHVKDEAKIIGYLDMDVPESWLGNEMIGGFTSEEHSEFESGSLDCSDGSMTDEESLIEIELPTTNYEWSEMNEEENLFEIDISIGSRAHVNVGTSGCVSQLDWSAVIYGSVND
nr:hypothetical protein [Tanacetum cinerariifolium]